MDGEQGPTAEQRNIQYPGINIMVKNIKKNVYITESLRCTAEINTTL